MTDKVHDIHLVGMNVTAIVTMEFPIYSIYSIFGGPAQRDNYDPKTWETKEFTKKKKHQLPKTYYF